MDITAAFGQRVTQLSQRDPDKARRERQALAEQTAQASAE